MQPIKYITSFLTFYLKGEICLEQNFVNLKMPNTILHLIPLGAKKESIPVSHLASVESDFRLHFGSLLLGAFLAVAGIISLSESAAGLIFVLIGANIVISAFETVLCIKTTAGDMKKISFFIFQKSKAAQAEIQIKQLIANRLDDTNNRVQTDRIVNAINCK